MKFQNKFRESLKVRTRKNVEIDEILMKICENFTKRKFSVNFR